MKYLGCENLYLYNSKIFNKAKAVFLGHNYIDRSWKGQICNQFVVWFIIGQLQGEQIMILMFVLYYYNYCESNCGHMKQSEQEQQSLDLYLSYPFRHFQLYKKIVPPNHYTYSPYSDMPICLNDFIQIVIQYTLLLLRSAYTHKPLSLAIYPGYLNKQRLHFYQLQSKQEKGFANINQAQFIPQMTRFIESLKDIKVIDGQQQERSLDYKDFVWSIHKCLIQCEQSWLKQGDNSPTLQILRFIERLNANQLVLKYHNYAQIKSTFVFPKTAKESFYIDKYYSIHSSSIFAKCSLAEITGELLVDLEKAMIINNIEKHKYNLQYAQDVEGFKPTPSINYKFFIDLFPFGRTLSHQDKSILRKKYPHRQLKLEMMINNFTTKIVDFTSYTLWQIGKMQFAELDTFWLKLKLHLSAIVNSLGIQQPIDLSTILLEYGQQGRAVVRQKIKSQQLMGVKLVFSMDMHLLIHWTFFPFLQGCYRKGKQLWFNQYEVQLSERKLSLTKQIMQRWIKYLYPIYCAILSQYKKKPFTL